MSSDRATNHRVYWGFVNDETAVLAQGAQRPAARGEQAITEWAHFVEVNCANS
ncbi:MAG TPA: hypothetical protein VM580_15420 [Labilithrix sp.]|nr:hypothetical protein [Labilithrix sp.]